MKYHNAEEILPARLVAEIQKYVQGTQLYIPKQAEADGVGERNGQRRYLRQRDAKFAVATEKAGTLSN